MKHHYLFQTMIGAFVYYLASGFAENYNYFYSEKFEKRNFWTGYIATIVLFIFFIVLLTLVL